MRRRTVLWWFVLLPVLAGGSLLLLRPAAVNVAPEPLDLSRAVTGTDRPLDAQGRVDLTTALPASPAPPPDENIAVALLPLVGTDAMLGDREQVLRLLGAPAGLPPQGRLQPQPDIPASDALADLGPLKLAEVLRWMTAQSATLDAFVEATRRPRLWRPVFALPADGTFCFGLPNHALRDLSNALLTRAELRIVAGGWQAAWDDLQALVRLHDIAPSSEGFLQGMVRAGWLGGTFETLLRGLRDRPPPPDVGSAIAASLAQRVPTRSLRGELEFERTQLLSVYLHGVLQHGGDPAVPSKAWAHVNRAMRVVHAWFDRTASRMDVVSRDSVEGLQAEARAVRDRVEALAALGRSPWGKVRAAAHGWWHGDELVGEGVGDGLASMILVVTPLRMGHEIRNEQLRRTVLLALALRRHRLEHGAFPATLDALGLGALDPLASDPLVLGPIPYLLTDEGCLLAPDHIGFELRN